MGPQTTTAPPTSMVPTVVLDTDVVSHNMAARLCISFLGHLLFLKNQVPLSVLAFVCRRLVMTFFNRQSHRPASQNSNR